jgi:hypothetical protein
MDRQIFTKRGIKILDKNIYFFTPTKQSYSKYVEKPEEWKQTG